jgi:uncharacterized membrane protein YciS (DUF1049 family)
MRRLLAWILLLPLSVAIILFAVANRADVVVSFDPFTRASPALTVTAPLFAVIFGAVIVGVRVGGIVVSFSKLRWRLAARRAERENARLKAEVEQRNAAEFQAAARTPALPVRPASLGLDRD